MSNVTLDVSGNPLSPFSNLWTESRQSSSHDNPCHMAIAVASCSQTPLASLDKGVHQPKQSMWQRLGWRKLLGRDDRDSSAGESQDETSPRTSSDHLRAKHDNLKRRISRKVGVGLPRNPKRQTPDFDRLAPRESDHRRALSADRRPLSAQRTRTPPPTDPRQSAPEIQWFGPSTTTVDRTDPEIGTRDAAIDDTISGDWDYPDPDHELDINIPKTPISEAEDMIDLEMELEKRWILNLSMHFRDGSEREKFFVTYAETSNRWRRVTVSCDYFHAPPDSLEAELKDLRYQRDKCARIYESVRESLLGIRFYDGVTNLKLETSDGQLHVYVTEDVNETIPYPPISSIGHLGGAPLIPEHLLHFESHLSGFVYKVNFGGRFYIKKEIPGPDTVDEFLYEINALHALSGVTSVIQVEGIIIDEERCVVKGLLISYAEKGALIDILYEEHGRIGFERRERWAKQIVQGLSEIHESGYVQGDFTLANIVVDLDDNAKIIDINRRGCPVGWEPPEIAAKIESNQRISMYIGVKTDLFQLGMALWALAMEDDEPERQPRPLYLSEDAGVPDYYRRIVHICLSPSPRHRLSAKELLSMFPPDVHSVYAPAVQLRHAPPYRNDWYQDSPAEFGMNEPRGMMRQADQHFLPKDFSDDAFHCLQHPPFEKHDLGKRSTLTLAGSNGDMVLSSKPSSSSTLNHQEPPTNDEYLDHSRYPIETPYYLPSHGQEVEDTPNSRETSTRNIAAHDHRLEPTTLSNEQPHLHVSATAQQPINRDNMSNGSTNQHPWHEPHSANIAHLANPPPTTPRKPADRNRLSQNGAEEEDLLTSSCLAINPALSSPETSDCYPSALPTAISPSTPIKRDEPKQQCKKTAATKPTSTTSSPSTPPIDLGSPVRPTTGNTGASLGLGAKFPAVSPFTNMLRPTGLTSYFKSAEDRSTLNSPIAASPAFPLASPVSALDSTTSDLADSAPTTSVEQHPIRSPINEARVENAGKTTEITPTVETQSDLLSLHSSSLPISPASPDSAHAMPLMPPTSASGPNLVDPKPLGAKPELTNASKSGIPLRSQLPVTPALNNSTATMELAKEPNSKLGDIQPTLLRSPDSTSSLIDSRLPISPATVNFQSITEAVNQPCTPPANEKPILSTQLESTTSLFGSRLPISPASNNYIPGTQSLTQPPPKSVDIAPLFVKPSESPLLLSSRLPISPASVNSRPLTKSTDMTRTHSKPEIAKIAAAEPLESFSLLHSRLPISPASPDRSPEVVKGGHHSRTAGTRPALAELPDSSLLLSSRLPISPASPDSRPSIVVMGEPRSKQSDANLHRHKYQITQSSSTRTYTRPCSRKHND